MMSPAEIKDVLNSIKPFGSLGLSLEDGGDGTVTMMIPLSENFNDKRTMFAGSIYSAMVLCGWTLAYRTLNVNAKEYDVVIRHSDIDYLRPVRTDARAVAIVYGEVTVKPNGKISVPVSVDLSDMNNMLCARFKGEYIGFHAG